MRKVQVSIHVELFGDQRPRELHDTRERYGLHVYADAGNFPEALLAAVGEATRVYDRDVRGVGVRVDSLSDSTDDERVRRFIRNNEPSRPVDVMDAYLLAEMLSARQEGEGDE